MRAEQTPAKNLSQDVAGWNSNPQSDTACDFFTCIYDLFVWTEPPICTSRGCVRSTRWFVVGVLAVRAHLRDAGSVSRHLCVLILMRIHYLTQMRRDVGSSPCSLLCYHRDPSFLLVFTRSNKW